MCFVLRQGCQVSVKELDSLLSLVAEKKRKLEQEEAERNMQILQEFLHCLRKQKVNELNEVCKSKRLHHLCRMLDNEIDYGIYV